VTRTRALSDIARNALAVMASAGGGWVYGYEICRQAGIKSGTLYPLLIRLEAQGHLEAEWQPPAEPGRPPRHAYRLTASGQRLAAENPAGAPARDARLRPA
jgi:DNA-binding PadR family transcriptional regulator